MRELIVRLLFELGFKHVVEAEGGADGLTKLRQLRKGFNVIIRDLEMSTMNGFEFIRMLRYDSSLSATDVPVLILTEHSQKENIHKTVKLGIHGFIAKPVSKGILEKRIVSAMASPTIEPKILDGR